MPETPPLKADLYEERRREIMQRYTPRLKALSPTDPEYQTLWDSRAASLHALRMEFWPPDEAGGVDA